MTGELIAECFRLAVLAGLPVTGAAAAAAVVAGLLAHRFGLHDPTLLIPLRAAAALATLTVTGEHLLAEVTNFTAVLWDHIGELG